MSIRGVIAASEPHTALAGARLLRRGGNAVDAIVAAKFAATVTELPLTSLGGGGACIWGDARDGYEVLDFFCCRAGAWPRSVSRTGLCAGDHRFRPDQAGLSHRQSGGSGSR
ncbi:gamma-glutamyltransferase [Candidatus Accumulibacter contiguus]|nr:gamma-glutamyltransferase [Candidatus Accumulibacter contiguus]